MSDDSIIKKRSVLIAGHRTSVSIESIFWDSLKAIAFEQKISINKLITRIDEHRLGNLSSAIRVYVMKNLKT